MVRTLVASVVLALAGCSERAPAAPTEAAAPAAPEATAPAPTAAAPIRVGMNLTGLTNFTSEAPFLDRMKLANAASDGYVGPVAKAQLDERGWPKAMPPSGNDINYVLPVDPKPADYLLLYDGSPASFAKGRGNGLLGGEVTFTRWGKGQVAFRSKGGAIRITVVSLDPANPIRNLRIVRADQAPLLAAGQVINPDWVDKIGGRFSPLRMMDWGCTNGSELAHWADRPKPDDVHWSCAPAEVMIAAANAAKSDLWITVPGLADDDYVRQLAALVRDRLAPGLKLHLEYSNEVWNTAFEQARYAGKRSGELDKPSAGTPQLFYGYRAAQVMALAKPILGDRMVGVLASRLWFTDDIDAIIARGVAMAKVGPIPALFGEFAIAPYFGDGLGVTPGGEKLWPTTLGWAKGGAAGVDAAFAYLQSGTGLPFDSSLQSLATPIRRAGAWAKAHRLAFVAYEGGFSAYNFSAPDAEKQVRVALVQRLVDDPRMGQLYTQLLREFAAAGGTNFAAYNDVGGVSIWGPWGMIPDLDATSPRYEVLRAAAGR